MTDLREAAQQGLEAWDDPMKDLKDMCVAMDAIRTALEQQQAEPVHGDIRALKYRIHELEGEVMGYKRMLDVAEAASQRKPLTEAQQVDCLVKSGCIETVKMSFESGPYDITRPSINASMLIEAVEAAHGIKGGT